jgi:hypothetical protein
MAFVSHLVELAKNLGMGRAYQDQLRQYGVSTREHHLVLSTIEIHQIEQVLTKTRNISSIFQDSVWGKTNRGVVDAFTPETH